MNINSTSGYSYGSSANKGISGLASGLDTESQVKELLAGTQAKIDKQEGLKQQTEWKQEIYRDLISQINTFQTSYFSSSSPTSLTSTALYNTMAAASESKNFKVTASESAPVGNTSLEVHQLASHYSMTTGSPISGRLAGTMNANALQTLVDDQLNGSKLLVFRVGDSANVTIDLKDFFVKDGKFVQEIDENAIADKIQQSLKDQAKLETKVSMTGGQLSIVSEDAERTLRVSSDSSPQALTALGLTVNSEAKENRTGTKRTLISTLNLEPSLSFRMTLDDGLQKDIALDVRNLVGADGKVDLNLVRDELATKLDQQFGSGVVKVTADADGTLEFAATIAGRKLTINKNGSSDVLTALGLKNGQSNRISPYNTLKELQDATALQGSRFSFEINGAKFSFSADNDIDYVLSTINASEAGVTVTYKPLEDKFVMTANDAGAGRTVRMSQTEGNLLNVLFGSSGGAAGNTVTSAAYISGSIAGSTKPQTDEITKGKFALTVNGQDYTFDVAKKESGNYTLDELVRKLNEDLISQFGTTGKTRTGADGTTTDIGNIELVVTGEGEDQRISLVSNNGASLALKGTDDTTDEYGVTTKDLAVSFGLVTSGGEIDNLVDGDETLAELGLSDLATTLGIDASTTLAGLKDATSGKDIQASFADGCFTITSQKDGGVDIEFGTSEQMEALFGTDKVSLGKTSGTAAFVMEGRNAVVRIDGMLTERNSNVFTYNGLTVELTGLSKADESGDTLKGKGYYRKEDGSLAEVPQWVTGSPDDPNANRWIDADGNLRKGTQYVTKDWQLTDDSSQAWKFDGFMILDADGNQMSGTGINKQGELLDASGGTLKARQADTITVTRDTDKIVEGIKGFVEEYNKLVSTIATYLNEEADYRDYAPLTDEQREEMTEKQIELWEKKAKTGLLRRDSILDGFLQSMRQIWYETNSSGYAIYQLGIETAEWSTRGQLTLSTEGEATLRGMLAKDPTGVMNFFTNSIDGAAVRVNEVIKDVANTSSGSPGSLVELAGIKGKASEKNNTLYDQIKSIDEKIERLKDQYETEKDRYWNQFNTMEQLISNMNTQSAWLSSQFSY